MANRQFLNHMAQHLGVRVPEDLNAAAIHLTLAEGTPFILPSPPEWTEDKTFEDDSDDRVEAQKTSRYATFRDDRSVARRCARLIPWRGIAHLAQFVTTEYAPAKAAQRFASGDPRTGCKAPPSPCGALRSRSSPSKASVRT